MQNLLREKKIHELKASKNKNVSLGNFNKRNENTKNFTFSDFSNEEHISFNRICDMSKGKTDFSVHPGFNRSRGAFQLTFYHQRTGRGVRAYISEIPGWLTGASKK